MAVPIAAPPSGARLVWHFECEGSPSCSSPTTKPTTNASSAARTPQPSSRTASTTSMLGGPTPSIPAASAPRRGALPTRYRGRWPATVRLRLRLAADARRAGLRRQLRPRSSRGASAEADAFYQALSPPSLDEDGRRRQRQALAGMLWSKQFYHYVVRDWLQSIRRLPSPAEQRRTVATPLGTIWTTTTSSPCPTNGSIPGLPPGTWLSLPGAGARRP